MEFSNPIMKLMLNYTHAIIEHHSPHAPIVIRFALPKLLKVHAKLHSNAHTATGAAASSSELDKLVRHEITQQQQEQDETADDNNKWILSIFVALVDEGQFGLDIYARDPDMHTEKRTMSHCCKYLINFVPTADVTASTTTVSSRSNSNRVA